MALQSKTLISIRQLLLLLNAVWQKTIRSASINNKCMMCCVQNVTEIYSVRNESEWRYIRINDVYSIDVSRVSCKHIMRCMHYENMLSSKRIYEAMSRMSATYQSKLLCKS